MPSKKCSSSSKSDNAEKTRTCDEETATASFRSLKSSVPTQGGHALICSTVASVADEAQPYAFGIDAHHFHF